MTQPTDPFPVTTALELPGMTVEQNLGITFGLVVRSMGIRAAIVLAAAYLDEAEGALAGLPWVAVQPPVAGQQPRRGWLSRRGHAETAEPAAGWQRTGERFRDPSSGVIMRVWVDPADGSRHYVPDDGTAAS